MAEYEFTQEQNVTISSLAAKMGMVGLFTLLMGLLLLIVAGGGIASSLAGSKITPPANLAPEALAAFNRVIEFGESHRNLTLFSSAGTGVLAVILLAVGVYIRRAATSFRGIVATEGSDITNLMNAVGSLRNTFSMFNTLLMLALLVGIAYAGYSLYAHFGH
ncbi:MAG: hypothetical protein AB7K09_09540 [Planctomycetota bacterium]